MIGITDDVTLVKLAFVVVDDVGARGQVRGDEYVGPILGPSRVVVVVVRTRRYLLNLLRIFFFPHYSLCLSTLKTLYALSIGGRLEEESLRF